MEIQAVVVAVGTELTSGQTIDTNSSYIARRLAELGIVTLAHHVVDDHAGRIAEALRLAVGQAGVVVVSGGLGPTADDVTRQGLAAAMGVELELHEPSLRHIESFFRMRGRPMNATNRIQAMVPRGAEVLHNPVGTAPGLYAQVGGARVFVVPGVPSEMRRMLADHLAPRLADLTGGASVNYRQVHTFGAGESDIAAPIADLMDRQANPLVGTTVASGLVSVRIIARGSSPQEAKRLGEEMVTLVKQRLAPYVVGVDEQTFAGAVGGLLRRRGATLAVAESCTGGMLGELLTAEGGSSEYFVGGVISYANSVKQNDLGVSEALLIEHGAVSEPVAAAMAEGARRRLGSTYALAVTGIAGPTGGTPQKPVGLVFTALATPAGTRVARHVFPGERGMVRLRSCLAALDMLRLELGQGG